MDAARDCGLAAISANDHFLFSTPWLDGPTALAAVVERSGDLELATTISLVALRGPVPLAKTLAALDIVSGGRLTAGVGPGSSKRDYDALGVPFDDRWKRFDEAVTIVRALLRREPPPQATHYYPMPDEPLAPSPVQDGGIPLWIGSPEELADQVCVGSAEHCSALLSDYARAGCQRVFLWPLGDEARQIELVAAEVAPRVCGAIGGGEGLSTASR